MHILFLNPQGNFDSADSHLAEHPDFGGQLIYVKEVARAMVAAGHRVDIVTRRIVDPEWPEFSAPVDHYEGTGPGLRIVRIPCGGDRFLAKERLWEHLPEFADRAVAFYAGARPDCLTAHYADGGYCAALVQARSGLPFTFTGHSLGAQKMDKLGVSRDNREVMEQRYRFSRRIAAERLSMRRACRIITSTLQERMEQYGHPLYHGAVDVTDEERFAVIPPGVNTTIFHAGHDKTDDEVARRLDRRLADPGRPHLLVASRLDEKKNIAGTVEAYLSSPALRDEVGLAICLRGMDDPFEEVESLPEAEQVVLRPVLEMISAAGLRGRVDFLDIPSQAELAATYRYFARRGSVFVLAAFYEPFGLAPIEAAACGLACVATRNGGPTEVFADGSGVLVDPFDASDIARGMLAAVAAHGDLSRRAAQRVRERYTWEQTAAGYLRVIGQCLEAGAAPARAVPALDASERIAAYLSR